MKILRYAFLSIAALCMSLSVGAFAEDMDYQDHSYFQTQNIVVDSDLKLSTKDNHQPTGTYSIVSVIGTPMPSQTDLELPIGFSFMKNEHRIC